ncbi:MAG: PEP-utilizing enzyme [Solirubrobacteraceae bacterium]
MTLAIEPDGLLHFNSAPDRFWSTANVGEALPGVVTPLGWSVWGPAIELGMRDTFMRLGALEPRRVAIPSDPSDRVVSIFYGRGALSVSFLCEMGNRLPGTSGGAIAEQLLGTVPPGLPSRRELGRMPVVATRMPVAVALIRRQVIQGTAHIHEWWTQWLARMDDLDVPGTQQALDDARKMLIAMTTIQARGVFVGVQAVYDQLLALIERSGIDQTAAGGLMAGQGSHAETAIIRDLWDMGRERLTMETFLARHGYHGTGEGQLLNKMWREDPEPVRRLAAQYAAREDGEDPVALEHERVTQREAAERELLAALPAIQRPAARLILKLAVQRIPLRGVAKEALIRALDVVRASARRMGTILTEQGVLSEPDDAFYFTADELMAGPGGDAAELARERSALYRQLLELDVPKHWQGLPEPFELAGVELEDSLSVSGIGGSGGVVEGRVRLVHDPTEDDVEPGEVLVSPTTDPSWASVLFLCSALVVDIGGPLSHAAVVSRELGIPCVIGTKNGTAILRTGDLVRVDGTAGTVEVLERASPADQPPPEPVGGASSTSDLGAQR